MFITRAGIRKERAFIIKSYNSISKIVIITILRTILKPIENINFN